MKVKRAIGLIRSIPEDAKESRKVDFVISTEARDRHGTILSIDGWELEKYNQNPIVGYQHDVYGDNILQSPNPDSVIGTSTVRKEGNQLVATVEFEPADINPLAEKIFKKVLFGTLRATSVGFMPIEKGKWGEGEQSRDGKNPTYYYGKRELLEFSIVNIPSNPEALQRKLEDDLVEDSEIKIEVTGKISGKDIRLAIDKANKDNAEDPATVPDKAEIKVKQLKTRQMETKKVLPGTLKECYEDLRTINTDLRAWKDRIAEGKEKMDTDDQVKLDRMLDDQVNLTKQIQTLEALQSRQFETVEKQEKKEEKKEEIDVNKTFIKLIKKGFGNLTPAEQMIMQQRAATDPQSSTTTAGGYLIPEGFSNQLEKAMLPFASLLEAGTVMPTAAGNDMPWPTVNDTSNSGALIDENAQDAVNNVTFGVLTLKSYTFTSKIVLVPIELLQDSAINIDSLLAQLLGERLGRAWNTYNTTGNGTTAPQGIVTGAADSGVTAAVSALTRDNILDLKHSVNVAYRNAPGAAFMFNDATFKAIAKLTFGTSDDRPLWQPSIAAGQPDTLEGKRYFINDAMADIGASAKSVIFGDLKKFMIRTVLGTTLFIFREKYMDYRQIGFQAYNRMDSKLIDAGTHPVKYLVHSAT